MSVWVPPTVARELARESQRREAEAEKALMREQRWGWVREFNAQLDRVVPGMRLALCPDPAPLDAVAQGAKPGYWHVTWPGYHGGPLNIMPLEDAIGARLEPGSWVFDKLARMDLWNERAVRERNRIRREAEVAKARRKELERAERDQDILERYLAVSRTSVSMNRDTPWAQNHAGTRRPTRGQQ